MKLKKTQITILIFFILTIIFILLAMLLLIVGANKINQTMIASSYELRGTILYSGTKTVLQNIDSPFFLLNLGLEFVLSMEFVQTGTTAVIKDNILLVYQIGTVLLICGTPLISFGFLLAIVIWILQQKNSKGSKIIDNTRFLEDLRVNMNQVQEVIVRLHRDVKALKKMTGLVTPTDRSSATNKVQATRSNLESNNHDLDRIQEKLLQRETNSNQLNGQVGANNNESLSQSQRIEQQPTTLVKPTEYIMPKRDQEQVKNFPTQQFLATNIGNNPTHSLKEAPAPVTLSAIFDRSKINRALDDQGLEAIAARSLAETFAAPPLDFADPTTIETSHNPETLGLNVNQYNFKNQDQPKVVNFNQAAYQQGDIIFERGTEFEILKVLPREFSGLIMYELTVRDVRTKIVKTIMKK